MSEWLSEWVSEWVSEWLSEWCVKVKIIGEEGGTEKPEEGRSLDGKDPNDVPVDNRPARTCPRRGRS